LHDLDILTTPLEYRSYRFLYTVYEVQGTTGTLVRNGITLNTFKLSAGRPVVIISDAILDAQLLGAWEGTVTRCPNPDGLTHCVQEDPAPVRVELTDLGQLRPLMIWDDPSRLLTGHGMYTPAGVIANMNGSVTFSDGTCPPSIASLGSTSPWQTTVDTVSIYRYPAMHAPGDYQTVIDYPGVGTGGMGPILPASPAILIQTAFRPELEQLEFGIHGTPTGFRLQLHPVSGGGAPCTPA
jgi:hypothetical protein